MSRAGGPGRLATRPVTEVMSSPVFSVDVDILLGDALEAMVRTGRRHLVAVDSDRAVPGRARRPGGGRGVGA
ncbi:CBS domain-containing protein [Micromonospora orduensis]|uniref:CBS domain-containing protein n=1 Tax=Micromonospora orduensis TaxID=1420891 RepID=A0A5C4QZB3_9ACTN|nr:CBS domain-containing protein [Micromonospora orduensis]TNH31123.1 CBS domain-containing protein [Micromonospora orduensis]